MLTIILGIVAWLELMVIAILLLYQRRPYSGAIRVINTPEGKTFSLELVKDPEELENMEEVKFKVVGSRDGNIA